jgi:hypothetical protein
LDAQTLNAKERHFILPLVMATFIMQSVAFISSPSQVRTKLIFPYNKRSYIYFFGAIFIAFAPMTTYLKDLIQSIGRYSGLFWKNFGLRDLDAQAAFPLSTGEG